MRIESHWILCGLVVCACRSVAPSAPVTVVPTEPAPTGVEKHRESLQVTPWELVFSGDADGTAKSEPVGIKNIGAAIERVTGLRVAEDDTHLFGVENPPAFPVAIFPGKQLSIAVTFSPTAESSVGVHRAALRVLRGGGVEDSLRVDLAGLVSRRGRAAEEPPLAQMIEALGYGVDAGSKGLTLGTGAEPVGDELRAPRLVRAKSAPVGLYAVGRYSSDERLPYGYFTGGHPRPSSIELAAIAKGQFRTLNPELEPEGKTNFDPADEPFGLWVKTGKRVVYTDDSLNTGSLRHAARVYPLRARGGAPISDALLVCFEGDKNSDYNDYVFVLWNARVASAAQPGK